MDNHSTNSEKVLLLELSNGDEKAFGQLFKAYYNLLGDFIMRITESEPLTEEIVQDVFLKIWTHRSSLAELDSFKAYLFVIARNHTFNCLKQIAREKKREKEWVSSVLYHASINVDETAPQENGNIIDEAVELLPPQQKKVYKLSRIDGMKQTEIAGELKISIETVKKHMVLALRFLKKYIRTHVTLFILFMAGFFNG